MINRVRLENIDANFWTPNPIYIYIYKCVFDFSFFINVIIRPTDKICILMCFIIVGIEKYLLNFNKKK
jgi:hypothetical protein